MLYFLGTLLEQSFGPARLLTSYAVLISLALFFGFLLTFLLLPKFYKFLPSDRGREFTLKDNAEAAKGKPTGSGVVFITFFVLTVLLFVKLDLQQASILVLTWLCMLTGYLDDRSVKGWGEYRKAILDLLICLTASFALYFFNERVMNGEKIQFWLPFTTKMFNVPCWLYVLISTIMLWVSINITNCSDGVDGLSSTLALIALIAMGTIFYFILGHKEISAYLLVPHLNDGASWGLMVFTLVGILMGYLWHNAFPSSVLMGDAGSRAIGFFIGVCVMVSGNPLLILVTSTIFFLNGGMGLLKVFLLRFFKIKIFANIRFPLHDHFRKVKNWSPTQVLIKFMILQILITIALTGIMFKVR
ncbi:MAG: phospho-N-acetylmuramoyl-pentapeptide-transferase [Treponemataceae bacterium]|nr:phospho-N-acetylmuramoyl-pentapeptide-transferase [Spirochaetales bacterium]MDY6030239.1 phospho-N-acetylmuramoyl-pentapeptide-transferase [Treponemataceae bacterium]